MLTLTVMSGGGPGLQIQHVSPMVYLDHWALRKFAGDPALAARFGTALGARGGTLVLSWLNLGEFATVSDSEQRREAEQFVEDVLPAIFCIDVDLGAVEKRELAGHPLPHADSAVALMFVKAGERGVKPFSAKGLFARLNDAGLARTKDKLAAIIQGRLEYLRETHRTDRTFREAVRRANHPHALARTTRTRAITRTLAATFFPDLKRTIRPNDAIDFLHTAIPVTYCDIVLLDGDASDRVERARRKLKDVKMATVFPGRGGGVDRFLAHLEGA